MSVVADAASLHYLLLIEQIVVLPLLYGQVIVPAVVCEDLQRPQTPAGVRLWMASPPQWLDMRPPQTENDPGLLRLGAGERHAILLAQAIGADILLIDERHGRRAARSRALRVLGTLGILDRRLRVACLTSQRRSYAYRRPISAPHLRWCEPCLPVMRHGSASRRVRLRKGRPDHSLCTPACGESPHCQHFRLSFVGHLRYTYVLTALAIPTPASARLMGRGRVGDDL